MLATPLLLEYTALTQDAAVVDVSARTKIELLGADRATFLHNFCSNEIKRLQPGEACEAFVCDVKGHTLGYIHVYSLENSLWIDTAANQATKLIPHWDRYLIREKVEIVDRTADAGALLLAGPQLLEKLATVRDILAGHILPVPHGPLHARLCVFPVDKTAANLATLASAGIAQVSPEGWNIVRVEQGLPEYGVDIASDNLPQEVNRDRQAISFTKGCYLGQETVARIDALGHVNRLLCGLTVPTGEMPSPGTELLVDNKPAARLTSVVWSPRLNQPLALGYIRRGFEKPGTQIESTVVIAVPLSDNAT